MEKRKLRHAGFESRIVQPVVNRYIKCASRPAPSQCGNLRSVGQHYGSLNLKYEYMFYVMCLKSSVNGTRKQTKQKIQTN
jgi:hypothetical protein